MISFAALIADCEADIRAGRTQQVAKRLGEINTARVPREFRLALANACRRAGLYSLGLTLLARVIHPGQVKSLGEASSAERAEYSVLLLRLGALNEALATLQLVNTNEVPESLLYRGFCHFSRWEFADAVPNLQNYLHASLTPYARLVGQVNLAYAFVECRRHREALALLEDTIRMTHENAHARLESNCHSLRAQVHIYEQDYAKAREDLKNASALLGPSQTNDGLFINKWGLVLEALESKSTKPIDRLRLQAIDQKDWESVREADLFSLKIVFQKVRFLHLIFGTPFPAYRQRIYQELGVECDRSIYVLGEKTAPRLDLATGEVDGARALNPGRKCHQLMEILLRDFYRPIRLAGIFSELFKGEHYDIFSSPDRVYQLMRRTRRWLTREKIPVHLLERSGFYSLAISGEFSFRVPLERDSVEGMSLYFRKLKTAFCEEQAFSAREACQKLKVSRRTVQRLLTWAIDAGKIQRLGATSQSTRYRVAASQSERNAA